MPTYEIAVAVLARNKLSQKFNPLRSNNGKAINNTSDGITNQKMLFDKLITRCTSPVSTYNQTKANKDVKGIDAKAAAQNELRLASSDTATNTAADNTILSVYCHIILSEKLI
jgi:hypothetical protein